MDDGWNDMTKELNKYCWRGAGRVAECCCCWPLDCLCFHTFIGRIHSRYEITIHQPGAWHCPSHSKRGCKNDRNTISMVAICRSVFARHIFVWQMTQDRFYLVQKQSIFSNCFNLFQKVSLQARNAFTYLQRSIQFFLLKATCSYCHTYKSFFK